MAVAHSTRTATVKVHCGSGITLGFVTPQKITVNVRDDMEWTAAGTVDIESLEITLRDPTQVWPFAGERAKGVTSGKSGAARALGTYACSVSLTCRVRGTEAVTRYRHALQIRETALGVNSPAVAEVLIRLCQNAAPDREDGCRRFAGVTGADDHGGTEVAE